MIVRGAACNRYYLSKLGVTHVLNAAEGQRNGTVDTDKVREKMVGEDEFQFMNHTFYISGFL